MLKSFSLFSRTARYGLRTTTAAAGYLVITLIMTWPLARGLARDVAWDLGDSLLNMWILAWDSEQLGRILAGDVARIRTFFDANIFYPQPLTLAYSEHLFAEAVQILPVYLLTRNPILVYNLLFVSTFALSGLGCYLLVRDLIAAERPSVSSGPSTRLGAGQQLAAFVAGLMFAFAPYRLAQATHLQVLSAQWMPLALFGLRRYFAGHSRGALAGAAAALIAQNLSCGYFLLYFTPVALLYVLWEIHIRRLWSHRRTWIDLMVAGAVVVAVTAPFLVPYARVRAALNMTRDAAQVVRFSADVYSYATASPAQRVWAEVAQARPRPEGELFPGALPLVFAFVAITMWAWRSFRTPTEAPHSTTPRWLLGVLAAIAALHAVLAAALVFVRRVDSNWLMTLRVSDVSRLLIVLAATSTALLILIPRARARALAALRSPEAYFVAALVAAWWLSLGPVPRVNGRTLDLWAPYAFLYEYLPGYEGLRVPARFAMIVALMLAVLSGFSLASVARRARGRFVIGAIGVAFLVESHSLPFVVNGMEPLRAFATPEARVYRPARAPRVYQAVKDTPPDAVLIELPFNQLDYDLRATYYSTVHWRRLVNGYSGFFPPYYPGLAARLRDVVRQDDVAWIALEATGATHVIVHEAAYLDDEGVLSSSWLKSHGAVEVFRDGGDVLFALPR